MAVLTFNDFLGLKTRADQLEKEQKFILQYLDAIHFNRVTEIEQFEESLDSKVIRKISEFRQKINTLIQANEAALWHDAGLAKFNEILNQNYNDEQPLFDSIITELAKYLAASQAGLFLIHESEDGDYKIKLESCYAYERKKILHCEFSKGESLVGQSIIEKSTVFLTDIPDSYAKISSGLGKANPACIAIFPLKNDSGIIGALELASFKVFSPREVKFVESLSKIVTTSIINKKQNTELRKLYDLSEIAKASIKEKEEEVFQQMEELQANNEELNRKTIELQRMSEELESKNKEIAQIQLQEKELLESKLMAQQKSYELIIDRLKNKLSQVNS